MALLKFIFSLFQSLRFSLFHFDAYVGIRSTMDILVGLQKSGEQMKHGMMFINKEFLDTILMKSFDWYTPNTCLLFPL